MTPEIPLTAFRAYQPSLHLRYPLKHHARVLQQLFFDRDNPKENKPQWRDVPLVQEAA